LHVGGINKELEETVPVLSTFHIISPEKKDEAVFNHHSCPSYIQTYIHTLLYTGIKLLIIIYPPLPNDDNN
jgi:hypothetical protein